MPGTFPILSQEQLDKAVAFANNKAERSSEIALKRAVIAVALIGGGIALAILCHHNSFGYYAGLGTALIPGTVFGSIAGYHKLDSLGYRKLQKLQNTYSLEIFQQVVAAYEKANKGAHPIKLDYFISERVDDLSDEIDCYLRQQRQGA